MAKNQEVEASEEPDFSNLGRTQNARSKSGIPTASYNRKVLTYSEILGEIYEKATGKPAGEVFVNTLVNEISATNKDLGNWIKKNQNLTREFTKPTSSEVAKKNIDGLNKVRDFLNEKFDLGLAKLSME